ncbi:MAG: DUF2065 domain-containing protein [Casimicrobium sp.]
MDFLAALCLVLVVEGLMPFLAPKAWRETVTKVAQFSDGQLRMVGLICIVLGLISYWAMTSFS